MSNLEDKGLEGELMPYKALTGPRVSALRSAEGVIAADVNDKCHGNTAGVQPNDKAILANVRVIVYGWGPFWEDHILATEAAQVLVDDLVGGPYFNGLAQYGVGRGERIGT